MRATCELEDKLCFKHNLQGKTLNVKRTAGGTTPVKISNDNPLSIDRHGNVLLRMYLENDLPLVVKYSVASLGAIKLCLAALPSS